MFSDSEVAQIFSCGKTKCGYLICFGIAPYFKEQLEKISHETPYFVALFDESYNAVSKNGQMDLHVRFGILQKTLSKQGTGTEFLGKASAKDLYEKYNQGLSLLKEEDDPDFIRRSKCQFGIFRYCLQE